MFGLSLLRQLRSSRGAVMVLVAAGMPAFLLLAAFAVDTAHFFDYSRNLQNRADAAALAAATRYGATCFGSPSATALNNIGETAQQYGGALVGSDVPYTPAQMTGRTLFNLPNLSAGNAAHLHLLLNSTAFWENGGTNWSLGSASTRGSSAAFCDGGTEDGVALGPTADVRITQAQLPLFFPLIGIHPDISAHARVQLQGAGTVNGVNPIAVPDPAQTPCLRAIVVNDLTGARINDSTGTPIDVAMNPPDLNASPPRPYWTVTLPAMTVPAAQLSVQAYIPDDCGNPNWPAGGQLWDSTLTGNGNNQTISSTNGIVFVNTYQPYMLPQSATTLGSVYLTPVSCTDSGESLNQDAYFYYFPKSTSCRVRVHAQAELFGNPNPRIWVAMDGGSPQQMTADGTDAAGRHLWKSDFQIPSESGRHTFTMSWSTANGNNPQTTDFNAGNPVQATFAAFSDNSDPPDDSGPVTQAFIGDDTGATAGIDSIPRGTSKTLTVAFRLQGLELSQPTDPPIVLRTAVQNNKKTGAIDCGQGNAASGLHDAIVGGCPDPVAIYSPSQGCVVLPTSPLTCAGVVPGNRRQQTVGAFEDRAESAVLNGKASPCNAWQTYKTGTAISGSEPWDASVLDPRIVVFVVTAPTDLSGGGGSNQTIKVLGFATFYITGWDGDPWLPNGNGRGGQKIPNCASPTDQDEAYPLSGSDKFQIWGHFIKYVVPGGQSNGQPCNVNDPSACVAALTR